MWKTTFMYQKSFWLLQSYDAGDYFWKILKNALFHIHEYYVVEVLITPCFLDYIESSRYKPMWISC